MGAEAMGAEAGSPGGPGATGATGEAVTPDAVAGSWVGRAPRAARPYLRLSRLDRPIGTWLLFLPCLWGIGLAGLQTGGLVGRDLWIGAGCALGALLMRGAGCTWNDLADRDIDAAVARTRARPLPSGEVTPRQAVAWMAAQALLALLILLTFYPTAVLWGLASLLPVALYPFAKRVTWWPQAVLGVAFNWGVFVAYAAHAGTVSVAAVLLWLGGIMWTLFYDTIYAHQDAEDDALIGVRSTARLFGARTGRWLAGFLVATVLLMGAAVILAATGAAPAPAPAPEASVLGSPWAPPPASGPASPLALALALGGVWAMGWHLLWQLRRFDPADGAGLLRIFRSNRDAGLIPAAALLLAAALA